MPKQKEGTKLNQLKELRKRLMEKCRELADASIALNRIEQEIIEIQSQIEVAKSAKKVVEEDSQSA